MNLLKGPHHCYREDVGWSWGFVARWAARVQSQHANRIACSLWPKGSCLCKLSTFNGRCQESGVEACVTSFSVPRPRRGSGHRIRMKLSKPKGKDQCKASGSQVLSSGRFARLHSHLPPIIGSVLIQGLDAGSGLNTSGGHTTGRRLTCGSPNPFFNIVLGECRTASWVCHPY